MIPIRKIYIDSRFKSKDSVSDTNFKIDLPETFLMPSNTGMFITDVSIPVSWYAIDDTNNILYWKAKTNNITTHISPGDYSIYTLGSTLQTAMNNNGITGMGTVTVTPDIIPNTLIITYPDNTFKKNTDAELPAQGFTAPYNSMNKILANTTPYSASNKWQSGYINLHTHRNLYIVSPNLGRFDTLSASGARNVIKKSSC